MTHDRRLTGERGTSSFSSSFSFSTAAAAAESEFKNAVQAMGLLEETNTGDEISRGARIAAVVVVVMVLPASVVREVRRLNPNRDARPVGDDGGGGDDGEGGCGCGTRRGASN